MFVVKGVLHRGLPRVDPRALALFEGGFEIAAGVRRRVVDDIIVAAVLLDCRRHVVLVWHRFHHLFQLLLYGLFGR